MEEVAHKNKFTNYSMCIRDAVETFTKDPN